MSKLQTIFYAQYSSNISAMLVHTHSRKSLDLTAPRQGLFALGHYWIGSEAFGVFSRLDQGPTKENAWHGKNTNVTAFGKSRVFCANDVEGHCALGDEGQLALHWRPDSMALKTKRRTNAWRPFFKQGCSVSRFNLLIGCEGWRSSENFCHLEAYGKHLEWKYFNKKDDIG